MIYRSTISQTEYNALVLNLVTVFAMLGFANLSFAQNEKGSDQCYLSRPYQAGVRDRFIVSAKKNDLVDLSFTTTYCNYFMSEDCSNAREEEFLVEGRKYGDRISGRIKGTTCAIEVRFESKERVLVTQPKKCSVIQYWGPHGTYALAKGIESKFCKN